MRKRKKKYRDGSLIFKRVRALIVVILFALLAANAVSVFNPQMGYSPIAKLLPMANIGFGKESIIDGYIYSDTRVRGMGPVISDIHSDTKKISLNGYIDKNGISAKSDEKYILINIKSIFEKISDNELQGDLHEFEGMKNCYSDGISVIAVNPSSAYVTIGNESFIKSTLTDVDHIAKLISVSPTYVKSYDIGIRVNDGKPVSLLISNFVDVNNLGHDDTLSYVSKDVKLHSGYKSHLINPSRSGIKTTFLGLQVDEKLLEPLTTLKLEALNAGYDLLLVSGYRSEETQKKLFDARYSELKKTGMSDEQAKEKTMSEVMPPGYSEHMSGLSVDVVTTTNSSLKTFVGSPAAKWIASKAPKLGLIVRYPTDKTSITGIMYEPWHLRYVGLPYSKYMALNNLSFDEFISKARNGLVVSDGERSVYFIIKNNDYIAFASDTGNHPAKKYKISDEETGYEIPLN